MYSQATYTAQCCLADTVEQTQHCQTNITASRACTARLSNKPTRQHKVKKIQRSLDTALYFYLLVLNSSLCSFLLNCSY